MKIKSVKWLPHGLIKNKYPANVSYGCYAGNIIQMEPGTTEIGEQSFLQHSGWEFGYYEKVHSKTHLNILS